jgi:hypothetical protein
MKWRLLVGVPVLAYLFVAVIVNTLQVRGTHLLEFTQQQPNNMLEPWEQWVTFPALSELIFRHTGNFCEAPILVSGKLELQDNGTVFLLMMVLGDGGDVPGKTISTLREAIARCDVNALPKDMMKNPLHIAIEDRRPDLVRMLLSAGARKNVRIDAPERPFDGMDALTFAKYQRDQFSKRVVSQSHQYMVTLLMNDCDAYEPLPLVCRPP